MASISKSEFRESMKGREVALADIDATPRVQAKLRSADADGDGKIGGTKEVDAAFKALDDFDRNGTRASLGAARGEDRGVRAAKSMMSVAKPAAQKPARGLTPDARTPDARTPDARTPDARTPDARTPDAGRAAQVRSDSTLGNYAGGQGAIKVAKENGKAAAVQFKADMDVDTDGGSSAASRSDRHYQSQTSMKLGGKFLDADKLPFVVLPPSLAKATGAKLGDLVEVEQNGKKLFAIYGDNGPGSKIGEASMNVARAFDPRAGPNRAASGTFTYTVLPGSGAAAGIRNGGPSKSAAEIQAAGARAFEQARARGILS